MQAALRTAGNETYQQKLYYGPYYAALGYHAGATYNTTTGAYADNAPSLGVTRSLGYTHTGSVEKERRGEMAASLQFEMTAADFGSRLRRSDIQLVGVEDCLPLLGLA